jgi:hypothetical protein
MRQLIRSKPWWSAELSRLKGVQAKILRQKRIGHASEKAYQKAKKTYQKIIHEAIKSS